MERIRWERIILVFGVLILLGFLIHGGSEIAASIRRLSDSLLSNADGDGVYGLVLFGMLLIAALGILRLLINSNRHK